MENAMKTYFHLLLKPLGFYSDIKKAIGIAVISPLLGESLGPGIFACTLKNSLDSIFE